jgi:multidrug transporter EmrE-like cation transporter
MHWIYLGIVIVLEIISSIVARYTDGLSKFWPTAGLAGLSLIRVIFYTLALQSIQVSTAYAIRYGVSIGLLVFVGYWVFSEPITPQKLFYTGLILIGIVGLVLQGVGTK